MNLRTTFEKLVHRAGFVAWPRLIQNLRSSCASDLMENHPIHVVTAWIGNTPKIALGHYLQTLETDFAKAVRGREKSGAESGALAVQNAVQTGADGKGPEMTNATGSLEMQASRRVVSDSVGYCPIVQLAKVGPGSRLFRKAHRISSEGKDRAGKPLKVLSPTMRKVFGDFGGHVSIQRSPPRWVEARFVDKAIGYLKGLE